MCDGPIRARLREIGIRRQEWECATPEARQIIKEFLRAEAELVEVVVAATLNPTDYDTEQIQKKAQRYLAEVTADLSLRADATKPADGDRAPRYDPADARLLTEFLGERSAASITQLDVDEYRAFRLAQSESPRRPRTPA